MVHSHATERQMLKLSAYTVKQIISQISTHRNNDYNLGKHLCRFKKCNNVTWNSKQSTEYLISVGGFRVKTISYMFISYLHISAIHENNLNSKVTILLHCFYIIPMFLPGGLTLYPLFPPAWDCNFFEARLLTFQRATCHLTVPVRIVNQTIPASEIILENSLKLTIITSSDWR